VLVYGLKTLPGVFFTAILTGIDRFHTAFIIRATQDAVLAVFGTPFIVLLPIVQGALVGLVIGFILFNLIVAFIQLGRSFLIDLVNLLFDAFIETKKSNACRPLDRGLFQHQAGLTPLFLLFCANNGVQNYEFKSV